MSDNTTGQAGSRAPLRSEMSWSTPDRIVVRGFIHRPVDPLSSPRRTAPWPSALPRRTPMSSKAWSLRGVCAGGT
jgi:hypothetical protein